MLIRACLFCVVPRVEVLTVHIIAHSHCDPGWLNTFEVTRETHADMAGLCIETACAWRIRCEDAGVETVTIVRAKAAAMPRRSLSPSRRIHVHTFPSVQGYYTSEVKTILDAVLRELSGHDHRKFVWSEVSVPTVAREACSDPGTSAGQPCSHVALRSYLLSAPSSIVGTSLSVRIRRSNSRV
jgi:hypothetical protein